MRVSSFPFSPWWIGALAAPLLESTPSPFARACAASPIRSWIRIWRRACAIPRRTSPACGNLRAVDAASCSVGGGFPRYAADATLRALRGRTGPDFRDHSDRPGAAHGRVLSSRLVHRLERQPADRSLHERGGPAGIPSRSSPAGIGPERWPEGSCDSRLASRAGTRIGAFLASSRPAAVAGSGVRGRVGRLRRPTRRRFFDVAAGVAVLGLFALLLWQPWPIRADGHAGTDRHRRGPGR